MCVLYEILCGRGNLLLKTLKHQHLLWIPRPGEDIYILIFIFNSLNNPGYSSDLIFLQILSLQAMTE